MVPVQGARRRLVRAPSSRTLLITAGVLSVLFATGVSSTPHDPLRSAVYDLVLFNLIPLVTAALSLRAARRVPGERVMWTAMSMTSALSVVGNLLFSLAPVGSFPSVADFCYLAGYPLIAVGALGLLHVRGARMQRSAWLDGLTGALGVTAVADAFLLSPSLEMTGLEHSAATMTYPVADVLLLALLVAVVAVLGLHADRGLLLITLGLVTKLAGDVLLTRAMAQGGYVVGGPTDLTWVVTALAGMTAAHLARPRPDSWTTPVQSSRTGWRVLVIPLTCTVASLLVLGSEWGDGSPSVGEASALACVVTALLRTTVTFRELLLLQEVRRQAAIDDLTGLPNRRALLELAEKEVASRRPTALLLLDLDGFKAVNDGLGHRAGDELLRMLGDRIRPALRASDVLARFGGDEFAVLLPATETGTALEVAERVHDLVCLPVTVADARLRVGASIGVATAPEHADTVAGLLHCADMAMYAAKSGCGGVRTYAPDRDDRDRAGAEGDLGVSAATQTPDVLFPPVAAAGSGRTIWADALARHPDGEIGNAGLSGLGQVLVAVSSWWPVTPVPARLTLSSGDLHTSRLSDRISAALLRHSLPPEALVLRLTQDTLVDAGDQVPAQLSAMRARGLRTAIDGYGVGALALARFGDLPADHVHLDPALTGDVVASARCALVVGHTVALARALGTQVTVDGRDEETDAVLSRLGCTVLGPLLRPLPVDELEAWLRREDAVGSFA